MSKKRVFTGVFILVGVLLKLINLFVKTPWLSIPGNILLALGIVGYLLFVLLDDKEK